MTAPEVDADAPTPARDVAEFTLQELIASVRSDLQRRGETIEPGWVESAAHDLRTGALTGWAYSGGARAHGIGFFSLRPARAYAHVHVEEGAGRVARALRLVREIVGGIPVGVRRCDIGLSGPDGSEAAALAEGLGKLPDGSLLIRWALERPLSSRDDAAPPPLPERFLLGAVNSVPFEAVQQLDWMAFSRTPDASLIADTPEENGRVLREILDGRLGRFLDEASTVVIDRTTGTLAGAMLTSEQNPRRAIYLDLMVMPTFQRQGIGRFLVRWGFRALRALGYSSVTLWVTEANRPARALYDGEGFEPRGSAMIYRWSRPDASDASPHPQTER